MKKGLLILSIFAMVFVLTGCGNKPSTLTCKQSVSGVEVQLTANFVGKQVKAMGIVYTMDLSKYSDSTIEALGKQDYCSSVQKAISQFTLTDCHQEIADKQLLVTSGIDMSKIKESDTIGSPEQTKKELEQQGYTCTLE